MDINEQAQVIEEFLKGLLGAFGLDGTVDTRVEDDVIYADINGEQTEALVGQKAAILQAIHELAKTVVQRKTMAGARLRLDIGGYGERRREALTIYAGRLAEQVLDEDAEIVLEPMNPADRKAVHDAVSDIEECNPSPKERILDGLWCWHQTTRDSMMVSERPLPRTRLQCGADHVQKGTFHVKRPLLS